MKRSVDLDSEEGADAITQAFVRAFNEPNLASRPTHPETNEE